MSSLHTLSNHPGYVPTPPSLGPNFLGAFLKLRLHLHEVSELKALTDHVKTAIKRFIKETFEHQHLVAAEITERQPGARSAFWIYVAHENSNPDRNAADHNIKQFLDNFKFKGLASFHTIFEWDMVYLDSKYDRPLFERFDATLRHMLDTLNNEVISEVHEHGEFMEFFRSVLANWLIERKALKSEFECSPPLLDQMQLYHLDKVRGINPR